MYGAWGWSLISAQCLFSIRRRKTVWMGPGGAALTRVRLKVTRALPGIRCRMRASPFSPWNLGVGAVACACSALEPEDEAACADQKDPHPLPPRGTRGEH